MSDFTDPEFPRDPLPFRAHVGPVGFAPAPDPDHWTGEGVAMTVTFGRLLSTEDGELLRDGIRRAAAISAAGHGELLIEYPITAADLRATLQRWRDAIATDMATTLRAYMLRLAVAEASLALLSNPERN